jgi:hypothetical protein
MKAIREHRLISLTGEAVYEKPLDFIPERWYLYPKMVKEKSAFVPFSAGIVSSALTKSLALKIKLTPRLLLTSYCRPVRLHRQAPSAVKHSNHHRQTGNLLRLRLRTRRGRSEVRGRGKGALHHCLWRLDDIIQQADISWGESLAGKSTRSIILDLCALTLE